MPAKDPVANTKPRIRYQGSTGRIGCKRLEMQAVPNALLDQRTAVNVSASRGSLFRVKDILIMNTWRAA
jgi:hypothetical protein